MLGEHAAHLLARTDLPNAPVDALSLPFRSFYLRMPRGMYFLNNTANNVPGDGVLVTSDRTEASLGRGRDLRILICPDTPKSIGLPMPAADGTFTSDDDLVAAAADLQRQLGEGSSTADVTDQADPIASLVFGFLLYLMSEHPELQPVPATSRTGATRSAKRKKRQRKSPPVAIIRVGRDIGPRATAQAEGPPLTHLTWVRGHWRNQAHGPRHALRKFIWIQPNRRWADFAEQISAQAGMRSER